MARNDKSRRPRGRSGPGRTPRPTRGARPASAGQPAARPVTPGVAAARPRQRLTGRAAVLVLVLAVLVVSYASSMRAYLQQRSQINALKTSIAQHDADIKQLESQKKRWDDPAYVEAQARERLGYVMPGETSYLVLDENGKPLQPESQLQDPATVLTDKTPTAWYSAAWDSVVLAGHPPKTGKPPASDIDGTKKGTGGEDSAGQTAEKP
jgi:cell division protein FtsB